jgi:hypothetical protein
MMSGWSNNAMQRIARSWLPLMASVGQIEMNIKPQTVSLSELRAGLAGRPFFKLINHHLNRQSQDQRIQCINGTIAMPPKEARGLVEGFIDRWNMRAYDRVF